MVMTLLLCVLFGYKNKEKNVALYTFNMLVFITEAESVYSAVRTECYITQIGFVRKVIILTDQCHMNRYELYQL